MAMLGHNAIEVIHPGKQATPRHTRHHKTTLQSEPRVAGLGVHACNPSTPEAEAETS